MRYQREYGILYDAIRFCILHFQREQESEQAYMDEAADILPESFGTDGDIPAILMPLFFSRDSMTPPIITYLEQRPSVSSIAELSLLLEEDDERDVLRRMVMAVLFFPDIPSDGECSVRTAEKLDKMNYTPSFKYRSHLCLTYFGHTVRELCRILSVSEELITELHETYKGETEALFTSIRSGKYDKLYRNTRNLHMDSYNEITVSFSLLHPYVFAPYSTEKSLRLLLGKDHVSALVRELEEDSIDLDTFLEHIGNELRRMILEVFSANGEMTASDVSRQTGIPITTALRHIEALCEDYLIGISHRKGLQIFYTLNREYLEKARKKTNSYLGSLYMGGDSIEGNKDGKEN